jgi:hypothetical protein
LPLFLERRDTGSCTRGKGMGIEGFIYRYIAAGFPYSSLLVMNELEDSDAFCREEVKGF